MSKVNKTDEQWREQLSEEEYYVTREKGTERPFTGTLLNEGGRGVYHCKCCNQPLFFSDQKFESHCGWPSFDECNDGAIGYVQDNTHGMQRIEIICTQCEAHIGHVFDDGPTKTGKRYCVNSLSLSFNEA